MTAVAVEACARNVQHNISRITDSAAQSTAPDRLGSSTVGTGDAQPAVRGDEGATAGSAGAAGDKVEEGPAGEGVGGKKSTGDEWRERLRKVKPEEGDARLYMLLHENQFDAVRVLSLGAPFLIRVVERALRAACRFGSLCKLHATCIT